MPFALFRDRNYSVILAVAAAVHVGMAGLFLPFTIYLQSVLGLSALQAGLVYVPFSLISMFMSPVSGKLTDRIGGKYILMTGLTLFAARDAAARRDRRRRHVALDVRAGDDPRRPRHGVHLRPDDHDRDGAACRRMLAGAASGLLNTTRQLGGALGGALVGAVLQNRLAAALRDEAVARAGEVPAQARPGFVHGFDSAGERRAGGGRGADRARSRRAGLPEEVAHRVAAVAHEVFDFAFVSAMRWSLSSRRRSCSRAALTCFALRQPPRREVEPAPQPEPYGWLPG